MKKVSGIERPEGKTGLRGKNREGLEELIGYRFQNPGLLREVLTHASAGQAKKNNSRSKKMAAGRDNERLEFLGDRVLGLIIADRLYERFGHENEGDLTQRLVALVRKEKLAEIGASLDLGSYLNLAPGEEQTGGRKKPALIADCLEALLGALWLDGGIDAARSFIHRHWDRHIDSMSVPPRDPKMLLQEQLQARSMDLPAYRVIRCSGPDHAPVFEVAVSIPHHAISAEGHGKSKREAERKAAVAMLEKLSDATL